MGLVLNEEQRLLQDSARDFLAANAPVEALRQLRDKRDATGYSPSVWKTMAELGWAGIILPEEYGGLDFGFTGMGVVLEETGRTLTASPIFASAVVGASTLILAGNSAQKELLLPQISAGKLTFALALEESHRHSPSHIATRAKLKEGNYLLNGAKTFVVDGHCADKLIVAARTGGEDERSSEGITLFLVDPLAPGVSRQRTIMVDSRNSANISFDNVSIPATEVIGEVDKAWPVLEVVLDRARVAIAAEMMGCAEETFERTVEYLKERVQFDVHIGSFQALQHRAAHMRSEIELCRSVIFQALATVDENPSQLPLLASLAKARLNELVKLVTNEAVQMHGGMGVTDELEIGFFLKRARVAMQLFGDTGFHKDRYATLCGY